MPLLTVIIPFLNENTEIEETVKSIRETQDEPVDIILINDQSQDEFNYETVAKHYDCHYIFNIERLGVAESRNLGVLLTKTPNFLIIDGHMRFYADNWIKKIHKAIQEDGRAIYCTQCEALSFEEPEKRSGYTQGAKLNFGEPEKHIEFVNVIEPKWLSIQPVSSKPREIPCILGGAYAATRDYYLKLHGLSGLKKYGSDEAYLSLKAWLEGGSCKVISDITIGHKFRKAPPYETATTPERLYNKLLIIKTVLPEALGEEQEMCLRHHFHYKETLGMMKANIHEVVTLKKYYQQILTADLKRFFNINNTEPV